MPETIVLTDKDRKRLVNEGVTKFYVRLGFGLGILILAASIAVWTGLFQWMLTVGTWGTLSIEDLAGFAIAMIWIIAIGVLVILFTLKRTLTRVEVDVQAKDLELDKRVELLQSTMMDEFDEAGRRMQDEHNRLVALHQRARKADQEVLRRASDETATRVAALRDELEAEIRALHQNEMEEARRAESERLEDLAHKIKGNRVDADLTRRVAVAEERQARITRALKDETSALIEARRSLDERLKRVEAIGSGRLADMDDLERAMRRLDAGTKAAQDALADRVERQERELLAALDDRVHALVKAGVSERISEAIEVAFRPGRFYKVLGFVLAGGLALVLLLALLGAEGPGWFSVQVAIFALGAAVAVLGVTVLILIMSFTDAVRTLRAMAG